MSKFVSRKKVTETLGIHFNTVQSLVKEGKIETIDLGKGYRKYNLEKYLSVNKVKPK
jgi:hypothetical protein